MKRVYKFWVGVKSERIINAEITGDPHIKKRKNCAISNFPSLYNTK